MVLSQYKKETKNHSFDMIYVLIISEEHLYVALPWFGGI